MNEQEFINKLEKNRKPITLFIGTSINPIVVPQWDGLVNKLLDSSVRRLLSDISYHDKVESVRDWIKKNYSVYEQGHFIVNGLGSDYINLVYDALFGKLTKEEFDAKNNNLHYIAQICLSPKVQSVVTYNYDNLLEEKIRGFNKRRVVSQYGTRLRSFFRGHLPVYHVHGYLPWKTISHTDSENDIVFGLEEYHRQYYEHNSWQESTQLHLLESNFCIFLCTSFKDVDMLKLRSFSRQYSRNKDIYLIRAFKREIERPGAEVKRDVSEEVQDELSRLHFESLGVTQVTIFGLGNYQAYTDYLEKIEETLRKKRVGGDDGRHK